MTPAERTRIWRLNNPEKYKENNDVHGKRYREQFPAKRFDSRRRSHLKRKFGLTLEQYNEVLNKQNHCCAICLRHRKEFTKEFAVDHNKLTKEIRGLLCTDCNYRLIADHTDASLLRRMATYIEQGTGWYIPNA